MTMLKGVLGAAMLLGCHPAAGQERSGPELGVGVLQHGVTPPFNEDAPPGRLYEGTEEQGTADVQIVYRTRPLTFALKPRLTAKVQVNMGGKTNFASVGAEWRQHIAKRRLYGQIGIGVAMHDGYLNLPDPFQFAPGSADFFKRYDLYISRTSFGSRVLFNPNLSVGVRVNDRWAVEASWEHFSHRRLFGRQNPGIDNLGVRLIRTLGRR